MSTVERELLQVLAKHPKGLRSEEIQRFVRIPTLELRSMLARLFAEKIVTREGQARGTKYFLHEGANLSLFKEEESEAVQASSPPKTPVKRVSPPPSRALEVPIATINQVRNELLQSATPMSVSDLYENVAAEQATIKAALDRLIAEKFVEQTGHGLGTRYQICVDQKSAPPAPAIPPRVVRRAPRTKEWNNSDSAPSSERLPIGLGEEEAAISQTLPEATPTQETLTSQTAS